MSTDTDEVCTATISVTEGHEAAVRLRLCALRIPRTLRRRGAVVAPLHRSSG
ncbi:hypothetical protein ACIBW9_39895 [Streptomyces sp. NPDC049541]|uniref:hypothetical protein n=1 Tax=Streptomyces sp. NPDC049541 TaxID=3365594 RepID=UPI0037B9B026